MTKQNTPHDSITPDVTNDPGGENGIPEHVLAYLRNIFTICNRRITEKLCNNPNAQEESFDHTWIDELSQYASPTRIDNSWIIRIDVHYLGGLRHFMHWEIADIGLLLFVRRKGSLAVRKVAILQSKRLYPANNLVREERPIDFEIGFARIADPEDLARSIGTATAFEFSDECEYGALSSGSHQVKAIESYRQERGVPVHYSVLQSGRRSFHNANSHRNSH